MADRSVSFDILARDQASSAFSSAGSSADGLGSKLGGLGKLAAASFVAVAAAAVGVGKALFDIGEQFDAASDTIRVKTGATGTVLAGLNKSFNNVVSNVPASFGDASNAIATLNQKLGLSGAPLEAMAAQVLNLSHITGTDAASNISAITDLFNNFGVAAKDQGPKLDELFRASQQTGIGVADLAGQMTGSGVVLRDVGFSFEQSAALLGALGKAGLDASSVMPALSKTMAVAAKQGKDAGTVFRDTFDGIKNAPDDITAAGIAVDTFGAKAGPRMAALIREGKLSIDALQMSIVGGKDTINKAAKDTEDFGEKWTIFKNRILVALEPIAKRVFDALGQAMDRLSLWWQKNGPAITGAVQRFGAQLSAAFAVALPVIQEVVAWVGDHLQPILIGLGAAVVVAVGPLALLAGAVVYAYTQFQGFRTAVGAVVDWLTGTVAPFVSQIAEHIAASFGDLVTWTKQHWGEIREAIGHVIDVIVGIVRGAIAVLSAIWGAIGDDLVRIAKETWRFIQETISNAVKVVQGIIQTVLAVINGDWGKAWDGIKQVLAGVWDQIKNVIRNGIETASHVLGGALSLLGAAWQAVWDGIKAIVVGAWGKLLDWIEGGGVGRLLKFFIDLPDKIIGWIGDLAGKFVQLGKDAIGGFIHGLIEKAKDLPGTIGGIFGDVVSGVRGALKSKSPSKVFHAIGVDTLQGYLDGLKSKSAEVRAYMAATIQNVVSGAQQVSSGIRAAFGLQSAQLDVGDARSARDDLLARQALLPTLISHQVGVVDAARVSAGAIDPDEQLRIDRAQQDVLDKTSAINAARTDGTTSALQLKIMEDELAIAQREITAAVKAATGPTDALTQAESDLKDLRDEQHDIAGKLAQANRDLALAQLSVVDAQGQLAQSSAQLAGNSQLIQFFVDVARHAGLSSGAIQQLVADLNGLSTATSTGSGSRPGGPSTPGSAGSGGSSASSGGWDIAAGIGPGGIRFTPGGGGLTQAQLAAIIGGIGRTASTSAPQTVTIPIHLDGVKIAEHVVDITGLNSVVVAARAH